MDSKSGQPHYTAQPGMTAHQQQMPPPGYMGGGQPGATVYATQPVQGAVMMNVQVFSPYPMQVHCGHCNAQVMTEIDAVPGLLTWLVAGGLCVFGCWLGCCLIPFCIPDCKDIEHRCPNCKTHLGSYRRIK